MFYDYSYKGDLYQQVAEAMTVNDTTTKRKIESSIMVVLHSRGAVLLVIVVVVRITQMHIHSEPESHTKQFRWCIFCVLKQIQS